MFLKFKHKFSYTICIILLLEFLPKNINAQTYPFVNYTVETGLSQGQVLSAFQDDDGVMWFGTSGGGIVKYDGNSYEIITNKDGLADNVIYCIVKDKKGRILIGTNNGLSVYDPNTALNANTKKYKNYTTKQGLSHNRIFSIFFDENNRVLLGTGQGISLFQDTICTVLNIDETLNNAAVFHIMIDSKHQKWFSTLGNGVFKYDGKGVKNYTTKNGLKNDMVFSVMEYSEDNYWFFTGEGLNELNHQIIKAINPANLNTSLTYYSYFKDDLNNLWMTTSGGVIKIEGNGRINLFTEKNGLVNNSIWKIFKDRESNLWFTSDINGISKLASERFYMYTNKDGLLHDEIKEIYQNINGDYWVGSLFGLSVVSSDKKITNYTTKDFVGGNANLWCISDDRKGNYLMGTSNGLVIYNGKKFKRITCKDKESQMNAIYDILVDNKGETWLGTQAGVAKVKGNYIQSFDGTFINKGFINKIYQDTKGNYWFGTDEGLYKYDGAYLNHFTEKDGFTQRRARNIVSDAKGNLWFATSAGVYKYNNEGFVNITEDDSLSSNEVFSIAIDKNNAVWVGLSTGIDKIESIGGKYKIRHYGTEDGFIGQECSQNCILFDKQGNLLIGTSKGLVVYQSEYDKPNQLEPITKLKSIDLFFEKTDWKTYADSVDNNNIPYDLNLSYDKNYLTFNFIGVSLVTPSKVTYQYMLKGIDKGWRSSSKTEVTYSNIPPGKYEFLIKANNGEGVWNSEPKVFKFMISPPFWKTWWFYSIIGIIVIIGIYSYIKIRSSNIKILKQNEIIEEKNDALQDANKVIAEKNQNITDSINYAKRIQQNFLTSEEVISKALKNYFILFKPRDIVSGDFYLAFDFPDRTLVICSDCTGHGIPGAFMSLISISLLNEILRSKEVLDPSKILDELRRKIIHALNPEENEEGGKDGMDIALISIFKSKESNGIKIHFSGAHSSMFLVSKKQETISMLEIKGDIQPVGFYVKMKPFSQHETFAQPGDTIYLYTDGYADQFGGVKGKKFMTKQLKQKLISIYPLPIKEQSDALNSIYKEWQGDLEQVDDVTVIGIKL